MKGSKLFLAAAVCVAAVAWSGSASAQDIEIAVDYYTPQYYLDYPVFFDDNGLPFYYVGGRVRYVPASWVNYHRLRRHWRLHRHDYRRWYRRRGHRFHAYRRVAYSPIYFDGYTVYYDPSGVPYYWMGGRRVWIPRHHPRYTYYRRYYRRHRPHYRRWYNRYGHRVSYRRRHGHRHRPGVTVSGPGGRVRVGPRGGVRVSGPGGRVRVGPRGVHVRGPGYRVGVGARHDRRVDRRHDRRVGSGRVNCRTNPGHPACGRRGGTHGVRGNRGGRRHAPAPAAGHGRGRREHKDRGSRGRGRRHK